MSNLPLQQEVYEVFLPYGCQGAIEKVHRSGLNMRDHFRMFVSWENLALLTLLLVVEAHKT